MPDDLKISALPAAGPLTGAERLPLVQAGVNVGAALAALLVPAGTMQMYAGGTAPAGWLLCDGAAVSRADHAALFGAIGTAFGPGDGSTTFSLPDMRGRVPVGAGAGAGLTARTLGGAGGSEQTDFTGLEIQGTEGAATTAVPGGGHVLAAAAGDYGGENVTVSIYGPPGGTAAAIASHTGTLTGAGNMQPFAAVNFIIKT